MTTTARVASGSRRFRIDTRATRLTQAAMGIKGRIVACTHWVKKEPGSDFLDLSYAATPLKRWAASTISGHLPVPESQPDRAAAGSARLPHVREACLPAD
jgi:hypothetical protein